MNFAYTWSEVAQEVRLLAAGFSARGFQRGMHLAVIGDNRPRLYWAQLAAQALGGVAVPVYQDSIARELHYVWDHAGVSVIVAEDQEKVDKVLEVKERLPLLKKIIVIDMKGKAKPITCQVDAAVLARFR